MKTDKYESKKQAILDPVKQKISDSRAESAMGMYEIMTNAYPELGKALSGVKGESTAEKLKNVYEGAIRNGEDPTKWGDSAARDSAMEAMHLDGLSDEAKGAVVSMLAGISDMLPREVLQAGKEQREENQKAKFTPQPMNELMQRPPVSTYVSIPIGSELPEAGLAGNAYYDWKQQQPQVLPSILDGSYWNLNNVLERSQERGWEAPSLPPAVQVYTPSAYYGAGSGGYTGESTEGLDTASEGAALVEGISSSIANADLGPVNEAISLLHANVGAAIDAAFSAGFQASTSVNVTVTANYALANPGLPFFGIGGMPGSPLNGLPLLSGEGGQADKTPAMSANGDIITSPLLSWVGEDGPEAIIPLGSKRRSRGLSLWQRVGEFLGVGQYARGGILGSELGQLSRETRGYSFDHGESSGDPPTYLPSTGTGTSAGTPEVGGGINISVSMSPSFEINNGQAEGENGVVSLLKSHIRDMTDEVADELAARLQKIFGNMPMQEV